MLIGTVATASLAPHIALLIALASSPSTTVNPIQDVPILEVVKVYGRLAGGQCYGMKAPPGSSCQIQANDLKTELGLENDPAKLSRGDFERKLNSMDFQWPLKPYGVDKSLSKTAVMNKGAETRVFMDQLESRGLYDKRNPTGALPTSLRPQLNKKLQQEGIDSRAVDLVFNSFADGKNEISSGQIEEVLQGRNAIDYYDFLKIVGPDSIIWPN